MNGGHSTVGQNQLCAWTVGPGVTWIQTRLPQVARKLAQRTDGRVVAYGVAGGYLKIFEFQQGLAWARQLIARYQRDEMATNERFLSLAGPTAHAKMADD